MQSEGSVLCSWQALGRPRAQGEGAGVTVSAGTEVPMPRSRSLRLGTRRREQGRLELDRNIPADGSEARWGGGRHGPSRSLLSSAGIPCRHHLEVWDSVSARQQEKGSEGKRQFIITMSVLVYVGFRPTTAPAPSLPQRVVTLLFDPRLREALGLAWAVKHPLEWPHVCCASVRTSSLPKVGRRCPSGQINTAQWQE